MSSVSPSLVEAAARAIRDALADCQEAKPPDVGTSWPDYMVAATAAHEAVGDALRLEGAQAEHARIVATLTDANRIGGPYALQAFEAAYKREAGIDGPFTCPSAVIQGCAAINRRAFGEVLVALGGVHPEASDG